MTALCHAGHAGRRLPLRLPMLETRRLRMRAPQLADADAIASALADYEVARMLTRVPSPYFRQDALDWLDGLSNGIGRGAHAFAVTLEETPVGFVGFDTRLNGPEIGYWLDRRYWGRGLMSEAVSAALVWYFAAVPGAVIHSGVLSDNATALKLQRKLGFAVIGLSEIFSLARNRSQKRIETRLDAAAFRPAPGSAPVAYRHVV